MEECGYKPCTRRTRELEPKIRNELSEEEAVLVPFPRSVLAVNFSRLVRSLATGVTRDHLDFQVDHEEICYEISPDALDCTSR